MRDYSCAFVNSRAAQLMELNTVWPSAICKLQMMQYFFDKSKMCAKTALE